MANELYCDNFIMSEDGENFEMTQTTKGDPGEGVPTGGTAGQVLKKVSNDDYDTEWADNNAGDIGYDATETYQTGTVGAELSNLNRQLSDLEDTVSTTQIINSASGAIASFADGADEQPIRKLVAQIEPVQDLHGYDSPWPAGGGSNILPYPFSETTKTVNGITFTDNGDGTITVNGTATATAFFNMVSGGALPVKAGTYTFSGSSGSAQVVITDSSSHYITESGYTATYDTDTTINLFIRVASGSTVSNAVVKPQINKGSAIISWSPYSNICPISGHTGAEVEQRGKNLLSIPVKSETIGGITFTLNGYDTIKMDGTTIANYPQSPITSGNIKIAPIGTTLTLSVNVKNKPANGYVYAILYERESQDTANNKYSHSTKFNGTVTFTISEPYQFVIIVAEGNNVTFTDCEATVQLELGSTATAYEPYTGSQISVDWEDEAGTVYGGTLTVNPDRTGTLVVDRAMVDMGTLPWQPRETLGGFSTTITPTPKDQFVAISSCYPYKGVYSSVTDKAFGYVYNNHVFVKDSAYSDAESLKTALNGQTLCYELATPIEYQFTESEISGILETIYGTNNIWSSTGNTEVTYPCDTRLFIEGKIAEAVANVMNS